MKKHRQVKLKDVFGGLQEGLAATLSANRKIILHPGAKGDASELHWLKMFERYLPARYRASKAFVMDVDGRLSEQIDIVIFDQQYSPFLLHDDGARYIPAESVYGVFEIKQDLSIEQLSYAAGKIASVRTLRRTSAPIPHAGGVYKPKKPGHILGGILTLDSSWRPPLGRSFETALMRQKGASIIDMGCCVRHGSFVQNKRQLHRSGREESLLFFFLHLLKRLQSGGTVPALDFGQYLKSLSL